MNYMLLEIYNQSCPIYRLLQIPNILQLHPRIYLHHAMFRHLRLHLMVQLTIESFYNELRTYHLQLTYHRGCPHQSRGSKWSKERKCQHGFRA